MCKACDAVAIKAWRLANPQKARDQVALYVKRHPEQVAKQQRKWEMENPEKAAKWRNNNKPYVLEKAIKWASENREKVRKRSRLQTSLLSDEHIKKLLTSNNSGISFDQCTPELIAMKREQLLLTRALRELNKTLKEIENGN